MATGRKIKLEYIDIDNLVHLDGNPRVALKDNVIQRLKKLIKAHGFQNPLQVFKEKKGMYSIICGNHRYRAANALQFKSLPCIVYTGSRKMAIARAISDNKSSEWTDWDFPLLKTMMADLDDGEMNMEFTGFDAEEIATMFTIANGIGTEEGDGDGGGSDKNVECPECGHNFKP